MLIITYKQHKQKYHSRFGKLKPHLFSVKAQLNKRIASMLSLIFLWQNIIIDYLFQVYRAALQVLFLITCMFPVNTPFVNNIVRRIQFEVNEIIIVSQLMSRSFSATRYSVSNLPYNLIVCLA
jgi:hypothetical protein